jgi:predicted ATP-dependent serine protease
MSQQDNTKRHFHAREVLPHVVKELAKPYPSMRIPGFKNFDEFIGGFRPNEFTIFCGSTGAGKTQWLASLSVELAKAGHNQFVMSVETGYSDYLKRMMSVVEREDINTGESVPLSRLAGVSTRAAELFSKDNLILSPYDNRVSVEQLIADLAYARKNYGSRIAIIDNLNFFMDVTTVANQVVEMDRVIHELIIFCKRTDMHIIMVMHPRKGGNGVRVLSEYDIKGSATAVQEAHNVILFNRPAASNVDAGLIDHGDREMTFAKLRRRGKHVGRTIIWRCFNTAYSEKGLAGYDISGESTKKSQLR